MEPALIRLKWTAAIVLVTTGLALSGDTTTSSSVAGQPGLLESFHDFHRAWREGRYGDCRKYFRGGDGTHELPTLEGCLALLGERRGARLHFKHMQASDREGRLTGKVRTYWVMMPLAGVRDTRLLLATDESITMVAGQGEIWVEHYAVRDVTSEILALTREKIAQLGKGLSDQSGSEPDRMRAGVRMYILLWEIAEYEQMFPLLERLLQMGLREKSPKAFSAVSELTRRAVSDVAPPKAFQDLVTKVLTSAAK